jgi:hypothetical protein
MECPACLCVLASKDPSRAEAGSLLRNLISENVSDLKEEFFSRSRSLLAAHAFWNSYEALTARYICNAEETHNLKSEKKKIVVDGPVIFAALL